MEKRIKIFISNWPEEIEWQVNDFLNKTLGKLHEVIYLRDLASVNDKFSILITYTPEEENEKKRQGSEKNEKSHAGVQGKRIALRFEERPYCKV
jgi:hypothetical protein